MNRHLLLTVALSGAALCSCSGTQFSDANEITLDEQNFAELASLVDQYVCITGDVLTGDMVLTFANPDQENYDATSGIGSISIEPPSGISNHEDIKFGRRLTYCGDLTYISPEEIETEADIRSYILQNAVLRR